MLLIALEFEEKEEEGAAGLDEHLGGVPGRGLHGGTSNLCCGRSPWPEGLGSGREDLI